jgi:hypothetical protein
VGSLSREKGANAERAVARILQIIYPDAQRRVSGEEGQGENLGRDIKGTPGLCVQVKEMASPRPLAALEEAIVAANPGEVAVAFVRQSRRGSSTPFRVVLEVRDFMLLASHFGELDPRIELELNALADSDPQMKARIG